MAKDLKTFPAETQRPMMTPEQLRKQAEWFKTQQGEDAQRAAELAELAANAQEKRDQEFTPEEIVEITSGEK